MRRLRKAHKEKAHERAAHHWQATGGDPTETERLTMDELRENQVGFFGALLTAVLISLLAAWLSRLIQDWWAAAQANGPGWQPPAQGTYEDDPE